MGCAASSEAPQGPNHKIKRTVFQKHVSGIDQFEQIPNLNWEKFSDGVSTGKIAMSASGMVWRVVDWGEGGKEAYCSS